MSKGFEGRITRTTTLIALMSSVALASASGVIAATKSKTGTATATLTTLMPISMTKTSDLSFGRFQNEGGKVTGTVTVTSAPPATVTSVNVQLIGGGTPSAAVFSITGEPNRAYLVSVSGSVVSSPESYPLSAFTFWSTNSGNITTSAGNFGASGTDTVRVGATVTVPVKAPADAYGAVIPVNITYQ